MDRFRYGTRNRTWQENGHNMRIKTWVKKLYIKISVVYPDPYVFEPPGYRIRVLLSTSKKSKKSLDFYYFVTSFWLIWCMYLQKVVSKKLWKKYGTETYKLEYWSTSSLQISPKGKPVWRKEDENAVGDEPYDVDDRLAEGGQVLRVRSKHHQMQNFFKGLVKK